jgi:S-adenosyl-L-methionine methyltransferase
MSRLDSFIRRMSAQRDCLNAAAALIAGRAGAVLELGLGNGRTFDHLRTLFPERAIYAFDRELRAHPDCVPDAAHFFQGELSATLPRAAARLGRAVLLAHLDLGSGRPERDQAIQAVPPLLAPLLLPDAVVVSDQALDGAGWEALALPPEVDAGRYYLYRSAP